MDLGPVAAGGLHDVPEGGTRTTKGMHHRDAARGHSESPPSSPPGTDSAGHVAGTPLPRAWKKGREPRGWWQAVGGWRDGGQVHGRSPVARLGREVTVDQDAGGGGWGLMRMRRRDTAFFFFSRHEEQIEIFDATRGFCGKCCGVSEGARSEPRFTADRCRPGAPPWAP